MTSTVILVKYNQVTDIYIVSEKLVMLNLRQSPIEDAEIENTYRANP
jgi:hypothetical protein